MNTDYSKMSDFEINCRVHSEVMEISGLDSFKAKDYCNNPSDAWPIIVEERIRLNPILYTKWIAEDYLEDFSFTDTNPLRAAMIVFLMMQESKNAS